MNRNKEYRLKRKNQRKDYIIQDKNVKIKSLYYQNETKRNKIEQLQQMNTQLQNNWNALKKWLQEGIEEQEKIWRQREIIYSFQNVLNEMQELEGNNDSKRDV